MAYDNDRCVDVVCSGGNEGETAIGYFAIVMAALLLLLHFFAPGCFATHSGDEPQAVHLLCMLLQHVERDLLRVRQVRRGRTGRIYQPTCCP